MTLRYCEDKHGRASFSACRDWPTSLLWLVRFNGGDGDLVPHFTPSTSELNHIADNIHIAYP